MVFVHPAGKTNDGPPGVLVPVGGTQTGEGGDHIATVGIGDHAGQHLRFGGAVNELQLVPKPLDGRPRHEDGAFQCIGHLALQPPGDGGHQAVLRKDRPLPCVHQEKTARAVRIFRLAGAEAGLAEEGGLLVPRRPADGDGPAEEGRVSLAVHLRGGADLRKHTPGDAQLFEDILVPIQGVDVKHHGAAGVGIVGDVDLSAGELPDKPGLHRAKQQLSPFRALPDAGDIFQDPAQLGPGEVGVDDQTGLLPDGLRKALCFKGVAVFTGAAALPHDSGAHRLAGVPVPNYGGLPLVGNADGDNISGGGVDLMHGLHRYAQHSRPDLVGVVLHPAGPGEILGELLLGHAAHGTALVKENTAVAGGPGVQRHDVLRH